MSHPVTLNPILPKPAKTGPEAVVLMSTKPGLTKDSRTTDFQLGLLILMELLKTMIILNKLVSFGQGLI